MIIIRESFSLLRTQATSSGVPDSVKPVNSLPHGFGTGAYPYSGDFFDLLLKIYASEHTSSGRSLSVYQDLDLTPSKAIHELHFKSGLTWDQLARLFGVNRRSVHFWASGKPLATRHEEKLFHLLTLIRTIDRGSARINRTLLLKPIPDRDRSPYQLLLEDNYSTVCDELKQQLGASILPRRQPRPLDPDQVRERIPPWLPSFDPDELVSVVPAVGPVRAAKTNKLKREQTS